MLVHDLLLVFYLYVLFVTTLTANLLYECDGSDISVILVSFFKMYHHYLLYIRNPHKASPISYVSVFS